MMRRRPITALMLAGTALIFVPACGEHSRAAQGYDVASVAEGETQGTLEGIAYIDEDDASVPGRWSGKFSAVWHRDGHNPIPGPQGVEVNAALEWARARASEISILVGGDSEPYSAGVTHADGSKRWPTGGIRVEPRPSGSPTDGSVQEVPWIITAHATVSGSARAVVDNLTSRLALHPELLRVKVSALDGMSLTVACALRARNSDLAIRQADGFISPALEGAVAALGDGNHVIASRLLVDAPRDAAHTPNRDRPAARSSDG